MDLGLPGVADLDKVLGLGGRQVAEQVEKRLVAPARALLGRRSKNVRGRLLTLAFELAAGSDEAAPSVAAAAAAMELLHAGSLIVDDIQDGSRQRRGAQSLHLLYGVPSALCTGNWLYFWPMRLLDSLELPLEQAYRLQRRYREAVERAHYGQALDLSVKIDTLPRAEVPDLCDAAIACKTGAITALAMRLGAILAAADPAVEDALAEFGLRFGKALQYFDDLGNLQSRNDPSKRFEDLRWRKPTAVWGMVAARSSDEEYAVFRAAALRVEEDPEPLLAWLEGSDFVAEAQARLSAEMEGAVSDLRAALDIAAEGKGYEGLQRLKDLAEELTDAY